MAKINGYAVWDAADTLQSTVASWMSDGKFDLSQVQDGTNDPSFISGVPAIRYEDIIMVANQAAVAADVAKVMRFDIGGTVTVGDVFVITTLSADSRQQQRRVYKYTAITGDTATTVGNSLIALINGDADGVITATNAAGAITLTGATAGVDFRAVAGVDGIATFLQTETATLASMTAGTMSLTINGTTYSEAFDTNNNTTVTNWVASHSAALDTAGITATEATGVITLVAETSDDIIEISASDGGTGGVWTITHVQNAQQTDAAFFEAQDGVDADNFADADEYAAIYVHYYVRGAGLGMHNAGTERKVFAIYQNNGATNYSATLLDALFNGSQANTVYFDKLA